MRPASIHWGLSCTLQALIHPQRGVGEVGCGVIFFMKFLLSTIGFWSINAYYHLTMIEDWEPSKYQTTKTTLILSEWSRCKCDSRCMDSAIHTLRRLEFAKLRWLGKEKHVDNDFTLNYSGFPRIKPKQNTSFGRWFFWNPEVLNHKADEVWQSLIIEHQCNRKVF